jgi:hypothetical protein
VDSLDCNLISLYVMQCEYVKEAVTSGLIAVLEQHKFIVLLKGMRDILSKLNLLNVSMQTQVDADSKSPLQHAQGPRECHSGRPQREWIDLSAPSHPMLVSGACVTGGDSFKNLVKQMKSGGLDQNDSDDKTFKNELVSSGGVKRTIGEGEDQHTIPVQGSCTEHAEAVKLLSSYAKGVRQSLQTRFVDINDLSLFDVLHPSRVPKSEEPAFDDFGVQQVRGLLEIYGKDIEKGGHTVISKSGHLSSLSCCSLLSDLPQYEVYKKLVWDRGWGGGGKSDEDVTSDVYEVIIMDDSLRKLLPDLVILIEIEGVQWLETVTCERGFSLRTQILTARRHRMGDSLLACLMMICSNGPSLHEKEEVEKFLIAFVARFFQEEGAVQNL